MPFQYYIQKWETLKKEKKSTAKLDEVSIKLDSEQQLPSKKRRGRKPKDPSLKAPEKTGKGIGEKTKLKRRGRRSRDRKLMEFMPSGPLTDDEIEVRKARLKKLVRR